MTSKQRANLRAVASKEEAIFQIGKADTDDNQIKGIDEALLKRELVKISVLKGSNAEPKELIALLCDKLKAEPVAVIGNKLIIYRASTVKGARHIEL